eukprot:scaffold232463_cov39-Tisochrysis_lutea.AAC.1
MVSTHALQVSQRERQATDGIEVLCYTCVPVSNGILHIAHAIAKTTLCATCWLVPRPTLCLSVTEGVLRCNILCRVHERHQDGDSNNVTEH